MNELQRQFFLEAEELLERLFSALQQLRLRRAEGRIRRELTAQIFRHVHTLKGAAGAAETESIRQIAHEFESVLDNVRLGRLAIDDAMLDAFEDAAYAISEDLAAIAGTRSAADASDLIQRLREFAASAVEEKTQFLFDVRASLPGDIAGALSRYDERHLREALAEGTRLFIISATFPLVEFDQEFRRLSAQLVESGEILATVPGAQMVELGAINFRLLYATDSASVAALTQEGDTRKVTVTELEINRAGQNTNLPPAVTSSLRGDDASLSSAPVAITVRVSLAELDDLISRASELFRETANALESGAADSNGVDRSATKETIPRIREQFVELEQRLIKLRMIPLAATFERAARAGRLAARATGKEVTIEISGGEVSIDKSLAATIADPLMHLVRNAVDHGIESPPERAAAGKETAGRIRLSALSESNRVEIYVADDGRGIDAARVGRAAAEREIIADPASVTFDQCLRLIFRPGFSTAGEVSETSGRGIGLEIVDQAMAEAGGEVRVRTESGAGTTFQMILPARLALVSTVLVKARDSFYHIDSRSVLDRGAVGAAASLTNGAIEWHGKPVPRRDLQALLGHEHGDSNSESQSFLIIRCAAIANGSSVKSDAPSTEHIALIVDGIEGEHQALVRGLGRHATRWRGVTGANELRDGSVALVLDVPALLEAASE